MAAMHHRGLRVCVLPLLAILAGCGGCREPVGGPSTLPTDAGPADAHGPCFVEPVAEPQETWQADRLWHRDIPTGDNDQRIVGMIPREDEVLAFANTAMIHVPLGDGDPVLVPYPDGISFEHVVVGDTSAVALISPDPGLYGHRLCLLSLEGQLNLSTCLDIGTDHFPPPPKWNGHQFQMSYTIGSEKSIVLRAMTGDGQPIEDRVFPMPDPSIRHEITPLGDDQYLTMIGGSGAPNCAVAQGLNLTSTVPTDSAGFEVKNYSPESLYTSHSPDEILIQQYAHCNPLGEERCRRPIVGGNNLRLGTRISKGGEARTNVLPGTAFGWWGRIYWDGESFIALHVDTEVMLRIHIIDQKKAGVQVDGFANVVGGRVNGQPHLVALAPRDYLIAYRTYPTSYALMRVKLRPNL